VNTQHQLVIGDARSMDLPPESVHLVVTSPPYPMVAMWDEIFAQMDPEIPGLMSSPWQAYERMHQCLDPIWARCFDALIPGGIACINIGDATRSVNGSFALYPSHARILSGMIALGFVPLPDILWRKPNNSPTKFMGSGMLPGGAYVTYEHEYVLVLRKGEKRKFSTKQVQNRQRSAYFWEERNRWFSDLWTDIRGAGQTLDKAERARSAAYPFELPYRLIQMYSCYGETVLDPFVGTGTTQAAALSSARNSIGVEKGRSLVPSISRSLEKAVVLGQKRVRSRVQGHACFVTDRLAQGKVLKYRNEALNQAVMTLQERRLELWEPASVQAAGEGLWQAEHRLL
jgi:DNA modification methylase